MTDNTQHKTPDTTGQSSTAKVQAGAESLAKADEKLVNTPKTLEDIVAAKEAPDAEGLMTPDLALAAGAAPVVDQDAPTSGDTPADEAVRAEVKRRSKFSKFALVSLILTVIAWLMLMTPLKIGGFIALAIAIVSVVVSIFGLKSPRRGWRDIATTSLIASAVLAVVVLSFIIVLYVVVA